MFTIHKMFPVEWNMSLTNILELFVSGTHQVPAGRSDIIPPACCGLSSLLFPIHRARKVSLARRHNHNTFTESFCWFATDALLHSVFVPSSATNRNTSMATCIRSPFSCHYSQLTAGPQVRRNTLEQNTHITAAAGPIYQNTHPNYLICHSTQSWWWNMPDSSTLSSYLSSSIDSSETGLCHQLDFTILCVQHYVDIGITTSTISKSLKYTVQINLIKDVFSKLLIGHEYFHKECKYCIVKESM